MLARLADPVKLSLRCYYTKSKRRKLTHDAPAPGYTSLPHTAAGVNELTTGQHVPGQRQRAQYRGEANASGVRAQSKLTGSLTSSPRPATSLSTPVYYGPPTTK